MTLTAHDLDRIRSIIREEFARVGLEGRASPNGSGFREQSAPSDEDDTPTPPWIAEMARRTVTDLRGDKRGARGVSLPAAGPEHLVSAAEAGRIVGVASSRIASWVRRGWLTKHTCGGRVAVDRRELEPFVGHGRGR